MLAQLPGHHRPPSADQANTIGPPECQRVLWVPGADGYHSGLQRSVPLAPRDPIAPYEEN